MALNNEYAPPTSNLISKTESPQTAKRSTRLLGSIIDTVLSLLVVLPMLFFLGAFDEEFAGQSSTLTGLLVGLELVDLLYWIFSLAIHFLFHGYLLATRGQTIGKAALKMRIVSTKTNQILPFWRLAIYRYGPFFILGLIPLLALIDIL